MKAQQVKEGMRICVEAGKICPSSPAFNEIVRAVVPSFDGAGPTTVIQLANGTSPSYDPMEEVLTI